jgi:DNA (cytosine-5)-methyltransferase 1
VSTYTAIDLFSGAGGATRGLRDAGYAVLAAVENDRAAAKTYAANHPDTELYDRAIRYVQAPRLAQSLAAEGHRLTLLTACPPCQPFSTLGSGEATDPRNALVASVGRFVEHLRPRALMLENVPGLQSEPRFRTLVETLEEEYNVAEYIVQAADFGVPQKRRRIIVIAIDRHLGVLPPADLVAALPDSFDKTPRVAGEVLALAQGLSRAADPVHRSREPQPKTLERIKAVPPGGGRLALPAELELACHARLGKGSATSIYGRIDPSKAAPTMTTRCTTPSCGRFIHPTEDRGLTLREAALLQTFPIDYVFKGNHGEIERQVGNAVPPKLAEALSLVVKDLVAEHIAETREQEEMHACESVATGAVSQHALH